VWQLSVAGCGAIKQSKVICTNVEEQANQCPMTMFSSIV
jgi:hypothetical protein